MYHSWSPENGKRHIKNFEAAAPSVEQTFVKPWNVGWKTCQQRMRPEKEPGTILMALSQYQHHNLCGTRNKSIPFPICFKACINLNYNYLSELTSNLHTCIVSNQQQSIYLLKFLARATKSYLDFIWGASYLRNSVGAVGTVTKSSVWSALSEVLWQKLLARSQDWSSLHTFPGWLPLSIKHMAVKFIVHQEKSLSNGKLGWTKEQERNSVDIVYLEDLEISYVRYQKLSLVFTDVFVNCVYTRNHFKFL